MVSRDAAERPRLSDLVPGLSHQQKRFVVTVERVADHRVGLVDIAGTDQDAPDFRSGFGHSDSGSVLIQRLVRLSQRVIEHPDAHSYLYFGFAIAAFGDQSE